MTVTVPLETVIARISSSVVPLATVTLPPSVTVPVPPPPPAVSTLPPMNAMPPVPEVSATLPDPLLVMLPVILTAAAELPLNVNDEPVLTSSVWNWNVPVPEAVSAVELSTVRFA